MFQVRSTLVANISEGVKGKIFNFNFKMVNFCRKINKKDFNTVRGREPFLLFEDLTMCQTVSSYLKKIIIQGNVITVSRHRLADAGPEPNIR
jgi:hypothetical protein